ncbi:hypothetical protein AX16_006172 [Volvariella volvacea WC 439]|nr:hypothetical protein AX16_006172 [Volvariella volvacea WC 439]
MDCRNNPPAPGWTIFNLDILQQIFFYFTVGLCDSREQSSSARKNLFNFALVCQQFQGPAIDALWQRLDSLLPLLRLVPSFKASPNQYPNDHYGLEYDGTPSGSYESWERFSFYSRKVRVFKYQPVYRYSYRAQREYILPSAYGCLLRIPSGSPLPELRTLFLDLGNYMREEPFELELILPVLAGQQLENIRIIGDEGKCDYKFALAVLRLNCKNIRSLVLDCLGRRQAFPNFNPFFPTLRRLHLQIQLSKAPIDFNDLAQATQLQDFELDADVEYGNGDDWKKRVKGQASLPYLKRLSLNGKIGFVKVTVEAIHSEVLAELNLRLHHDHKISNDNQDFGDQLRLGVVEISRKWSKSIATLQIHPDSTHLAEDFTTLVSSFSRLQCFKLIGGMNQPQGIPMLARSALAPIKSKLPQLQALHLPHSLRLSLADLHDLVSCLPHLRTLFCTLSLKQVPALNSHAPLSHHLTALQISDASDRFPEEDLTVANLVIHHLYGMFPNLKDIGSECRGWSSALSVIKLFRSFVKQSEVSCMA